MTACHRPSRAATPQAARTGNIARLAGRGTPAVAGPTTSARQTRSAGVLLLMLMAAACGGDGGGSGMAGGMEHLPVAGVDTAGLRALEVPAEHSRGRELFDATCASCHGEAALGTQAGPPLVHIVYEPNHHGDAAFILAAERGVRAHHWGFDDMPPQPGISREEVMAVVGYVRWLQREAGVY